MRSLVLEADQGLTEEGTRVSSLVGLAEYVLDDVEDAREWLTKPHPLLAGRTPLQAAESEDGDFRARQILNDILYGLPV